jgi:DNA polymerase elongation subunit (family B)
MREELMANILIFDIETAPHLAYVWSAWKNNIYKDQWQSKGYIMSFAAKWLGSDEIIYEENRHNDDKQLVSRLFSLFDEADVVVAHNGDKFDIPYVTGRGIVHGFKPYSPFHSIDTLKVARKNMRVTNNTLENLCVELGLPLKGGHKNFDGFKLWKECLRQNDDAWDEMKEYNVQDIVSLEALYLRLRPYMRNHPNVSESCECPKCNSFDVQRRGYIKSKVGLTYQRYYCKSCGGWHRSKTSIKELATENRNA